VAVRFLADESCDFAVVRALREAAFDVVAVVEHSPGATDDQVIALSVNEQRVLLTEDKDFGQLVFAAKPRVRRCNLRPLSRERTRERGGAGPGHGSAGAGPPRRSFRSDPTPQDPNQAPSSDRFMTRPASHR